MRAVIQRVSEASVTVDGTMIGQIQRGLMVLVGIVNDDDHSDYEWLSNKIINMRIFDDENGVMNKSLIEMGGEILLISQFTLHASTKKGNRPSYIAAAKPEISLPLYQAMISYLQKELAVSVQTGKFGADMKVALINDGPVTITIDSKNKE
jgi:D-tyrosyl-tRNA(Tyr) deacylase